MCAAEHRCGKFSAVSEIGQSARADYRGGRGCCVVCGAMSDAVQSSSSEHCKAASDHERAARQHRAAAGFHDKNMLHAARMSAESARASCIAAHRHSMTACDHSEAGDPLT